jgi:indole-3-glycerol phosphate synthase/phosphoribosylanthranilate isomerase
LEGRGGDRILFDHGDGGTGKTFDWAQLAGHPELTQGIIAGGIGPHNARAAADLGAYAIDVGSSMDESPGVKSADKMNALFAALRPPSRERTTICA